ncbi:murein hydrolase activator EnvC family protein [Vibrio zhugei]|uniref:Murein hydrolase activator EnvC family protein n=1 Tax=Vibrio zhugei TaxID=2479546 RepID=A0ABV7C3H6_9VIBR
MLIKLCPSFLKRSSPIVLNSAILFASALAMTMPQTSMAASQQELTGVKNEIQRQELSLSRQRKKLDALQNDLKQQELHIAAQKKQINKTKSKQAQTNRKIAALRKKIDHLEQQRQQQTKQLKTLLQTYYITERSFSTEHILSSGMEEDRISQYYQHLAKARTKAINELETTHRELDNSESQLHKERDKIAELLKQQTQKYQQLDQSQTQRRQTLAKIKKGISGDKVYLAELQQNENRLKAEIAKAEKAKAARQAAASISMDGLAKQRHQLPWPIKGTVLHRFGEHQSGQINWKGIVIQAHYGDKVKAVASGTIVFSDYLRGYGLMVLIDHGQGYMTLYGFNQSLTKKEGDRVAAGETIALAGDTGGQQQASLYFEVRRNSKAENPLNWLKR